jgi:hypothetical protein
VIEVNKLETLLARAAEAAPQLVAVLAGSDEWAEVEDAVLGTLEVGGGGGGGVCVCVCVCV